MPVASNRQYSKAQDFPHQPPNKSVDILQLFHFRARLDM